MKLVHILCFVILSLVTCSDSRPQKKAATTTVYDALKAHGLPMGLLPKDVKDFEIDEKGNFEVHLDQACNAKFESELHYDRNVSGTLSYGQIGSLSGISAQELFLWFPVKGIRVDIPSSGLIYFDVGVVFKQFSLSLFETPPECVAVRTLDRNYFPDTKRSLQTSPACSCGCCSEAAAEKKENTREILDKAANDCFAQCRRGFK